MLRLLPPFRRWFALLAGALVAVTNPLTAHAESPAGARIDKALVAAADYLLDRQSADGSWRSQTYGTFKEGDALTPLLVDALLHTPQSERREAACRKGLEYLSSMVRPEGTIDPGHFGLTYPVYTAATAAVVLNHSMEEGDHRGRDGWIEFLRRQQLTGALGWQPHDRQYGGWSYAKDLPLKPAAGMPIPTLTEPNLSATRCALEALRALGCSRTDSAVLKARKFVERCQNFAELPIAEDRAFDDGGFFFIQDDPVRNKAGVAGTDHRDRRRFFSYGSTTADGLRSLLASGFPPDHARVAAARGWLEEHFRPDVHVGTYAPDREGARPSLYYYYCSSVAHAFRAAGCKSIVREAVTINWAAELAESLVRKQRPDGSWTNPSVDVREDDPLVATSLAIQALAVCRECLGSN